MLIWNSPIKLELPWFEEMLEQDASPAERLAAMEEMLGEKGHVWFSDSQTHLTYGILHRSPEA
jgi:hypothetical protein